VESLPWTSYCKKKWINMMQRNSVCVCVCVYVHRSKEHQYKSYSDHQDGSTHKKYICIITIIFSWYFLYLNLQQQ
jgi:hypothetical protein